MAASPLAIGQGGTSDADAEVGGAVTVIGESAFSWENPNASLFATGLDQRSAGPRPFRSNWFLYRSFSRAYVSTSSGPLSSRIRTILANRRANPLG